MFLLNSTIHSRADFQDDGMKFKNAVLKDFFENTESNKEEKHMLRN